MHAITLTWNSDKIWISLKFLWNFWSNKIHQKPQIKKKYEHTQAFLTNFFLKRAPPNRKKLKKKGAICCQKWTILEQSNWSQAGCLKTANLATTKAELASEASLRLSFLINSWSEIIVNSTFKPKDFSKNCHLYLKLR